MLPQPEIPTLAELGQEPFDPYHLSPLATLNRRAVLPLPAAEPGWVGRLGRELCSKMTLLQLIQSRAAELGLADADPASLPQRLNALLEAPPRRAAQEVAQLHGRRLGVLLASTLLGSGSFTAQPAPWEAAYLEHWSSEVHQIFLGGGLASGRLGEHIRAAAEQALAECGLGDRAVRLAPHPSFLPLIGAARAVGAGPWQAAVVADFGGTRAKRGLAFYDAQGALLRLDCLPPVWIEPLTGESQTAQLAAAMVDLIADTLRQAPSAAVLAPRVMCSVAAYIRHGQPIRVAGRNMGIYSWLHQLTAGGGVTGWFSEQLSAACGRTLQFELVHDGDAAAQALAGQPRAAVVMLGSALGVGFVPPAGENYRPLADGFPT